MRVVLYPKYYQGFRTMSRTGRAPWTLGLFCLALLIDARGAGGFQDPTPTPEGETPPPAAVEATPTPPPTPSPSPTPVPPQRANPRATMTTYLDAMFEWIKADEPNEAAAQDAIACMDLSDLEDLPAVAREEAAEKLARDLGFIMDRLAYVNVAIIPEAPQGAPYTWWSLQDGSIRSGTIEIVRMTEGDRAGEWLFSAATLADLEAWTPKLAAEPVVRGVIEGRLTPSQWMRSKLPAPLLRPLFYMEVWQWFALIALAIAGVTLDRILTALIRSYLIRRLRRWFGDVDPKMLRKSLRPIGLLAMTFVWRFGTRLLDLPAQINATLIVAITIVTVVAVVWAAYGTVDMMCVALAARARQTESKFDDLLVPLFRKSAKIVITLFSLVFVAETFDWEQYRTLLTGLGIGGLAFALAAQDTVSNLFGSFTVILDRPFEVGDWIVIGGVEGTVEAVGFRSTRVRTFYNSLITLPNSTLISASVDNYGRRQYRRWKTMLSIAYETPPEKIEAFCEGIRELIRTHPYTRKDYFHVYLNAFAGSSLDILVYVFHEVPDWSTELRERHRLGVDIIRLAQRLGVAFAYPTQTLYMKRGGETGPVTDPPKRRGDINDALRQGRAEARTIVESILGKGAAIPPPVEFGSPDRTGFDDDEAS